MSKIVAVRKDKSNGNLIAFKLDNNQELSYDDCYRRIEAGEIEGVYATTGKEGVPVIRGVADGDTSNNLSNLPEF